MSTAYDLSCVFVMDYKLTFHGCNINNTRFVGLEFCVEGK